MTHVLRNFFGVAHAFFHHITQLGVINTSHSQTHQVGEANQADGSARDAPTCDIVLTTPGDGLKRYYTRVRVSKKKKRYKRVVNYQTNEYLVDVIDYYNQIPEKMDVAVWNFFPVMGGEDSIRDWNKAGYAQGDMIHLTREGYRLQARLLVMALKDVLDGQNSIKE